MSSIPIYDVGSFVPSSRHKIQEVSFATVLTDEQRHAKGIQEYMLNLAAHALARELLELHDIWEIDTQYDICTLSTRIRHKIRVLTTEQR